MGQPGQHVLIADDNTNRRLILGFAIARTSHWATNAQNSEEALAVLRSVLHPLVIVVHARLPYPVDGPPGSLLRMLLATPEFTATHAFIVLATSRRDDERRLVQEAMQRLGDTYIRWMEPPIDVVHIVRAIDEAERFLKSRP